MSGFEILIYTVFGLLLWFSGRYYLEKAREHKILDNPSERSSHRVPTVRGGGIVIFTAIILWLVYETVSPGNKNPLLFSLAFILLSAIGFIDDRRALSPTIRFPFQLIAVIMILHAAGLFRADFHWIIKVAAVVVSLGFIMLTILWTVSTELRGFIPLFWF